MVFEIEGKIALITGAASGIGFHSACELLKHGLKAITIVDIDAELGKYAEDQLNQQYEKKVAHFVQADLTKSNEMKNAYDSAIDTWKSLDIVINNAGMMKDSEWEKEIALHCNAVVAGSLMAMEYMGTNKGRKGGLVVNTASVLGLYPFSGCPVYVGTKHFILGLTRSFGQPYYYNMTGVKFLLMCPGLTETPLVDGAEQSTLKNFEGLGKLTVEALASLPSQKPENVAKAMITLITQGENGSVWVSDGGFPVHEIEMVKKYKKKSEL